MIIIVGSLESIYLDLNHNVSLWAEKKYIEQSKTSFANFHYILTIAKDLCGSLYRGRSVGKVSTIAHIPKKIDVEFTTMYLCSSQYVGIDINYYDVDIMAWVVKSYHNSVDIIISNIKPHLVIVVVEERFLL